MFKVILQIIFIASLASCAMSGGSTHEKDNQVLKFMTGNSKIDAVKNVHIVNVIRAIGAPSSSITVDEYKYYRWDYTKSAGVSTILGGGSTTFFCNFTAETQNNKVQFLNWYGNRCDVFLDLIDKYFRNKLNIVLITDEQIVEKAQPTSEKKQPLQKNKKADFDELYN
jgi:hypothetical protein